MEPDFMEPPVLQRQYAIGPGSELTANEREDIRIAREDELREARNMDNIIADNPNRGGRKSRRRRKTRRHKKSRRHKKQEDIKKQNEVKMFFKLFSNIYIFLFKAL